MEKHIEENFKKQSKAKLPWSIKQARRMYRHGFDKKTRSGRHRRLTFMFSNLGMLRKNASRSLRIVYRITRSGKIKYGKDSQVRVVRETARRPFLHGFTHADKNASAARRRDFYMPDHVPALDLWPVQEFEDYLRTERPPSGGYLLAAPLGRYGHRTTRYGSHGTAFIQAYKHAFPKAKDFGNFGSGSARKSLAQWLWTAGWAKRIIADAGGWFSRKSAVDLYFKTEPRRILEAIRSIGRTSGRNRR
jgi:hypothetical protein